MLPAPTQPLSVAQTIQLLSTILSDLILTVEGEVANYGVSQGKFVFFDLKDEEQEARLSCFMMLFKQTVPLEDGMRVTLRCRPSIHMRSGKFSLTVEHIEPKGEGSLKRAFELLKSKLEKEGLFAPQRKRSLPRYPRRIGVLSSTEAAGYGDFMRIAAQRLGGVEFVVAHCAVQGLTAVDDLCFGLDHLNSHHKLDLIVVVRGGGSAEDLHAFNTEAVARAIVRSRVPVVVGVGHERDITIADFVADIRAATPSNAAQLVLPTNEEVQSLVFQLVQQGAKRVVQAIRDRQNRITVLATGIHDRLGFHLKLLSEQVTRLTKTIDAISPQATLKRGYSLTWSEQGLVTSAKAVKPGTSLRTQLADGSINSTTL